MLVGNQQFQTRGNSLRIAGIVICGLLVLGVLVIFAHPVFAQPQDFGAANLNGLTPLKGGDLRQIVLNAIRIFLGFLALIALVIVIIAGFKWMTAGGDPKKVETARKMIVNASIGLAIIFLSYSITLFVFSLLKEATNGGSPGGACTPGQCQGCFRCDATGVATSWDNSCSQSCSGGPLGSAFRLKSVETAHGGTNPQQDVYACSTLEGIFNNYVNKATLFSGTTIVDMKTNASVPGVWSASANVLHFDHPAGATFTKGTASTPHPYQARFEKSLTDTSGLFLSSCLASVNCSVESSYLAWNFAVGTNDDVSKPFVVSSYPESDPAKLTYPNRDVSPNASLEVMLSESVNSLSYIDPPSLDPASPACQATPKPVGCYAHPKSGVISIQEVGAPSLDPASPACQATPKPAGCLPGALGTELDRSGLEIHPEGKSFRLSFIRPNQFKPFTWYRISLANIKDLCGNVMDTPRTWVWQTNGSTPSIVGYPTKDNVCTDSKILFSFGTPMVDARVSFSLLGSDNSRFEIALEKPNVSGITSVMNSDGTLRILDAKSPVDNGYRQFEFIPARPLSENVTYNVSVTTDYVVSSDGGTLAKTWQFATADAATCQCAPFIQRINPERGPAGMCVTVSGYCFAGTSSVAATPRGLVFNAAPAVIEFSNASYLTTTVPQSITLGTSAKPNFELLYPNSTAGSSNQTVEYFVDQSGTAQGPCLLSLAPNKGSLDTGVVARGKRFGDFDIDASAILFTPAVSGPLEESTWSDSQAQTRVPGLAMSGDVVVRNQRGTSNGIVFTVLAGVGEACSQTPDVCSPDPSICDSSQGLTCSPTCRCVSQGGGESGTLKVLSKSPTCSAACTNSVLVARVSAPLLASSVSNSSMELAPCLTSACNTLGPEIPITVQYYEDLSASVFELVGTPNASLPIATSFRATLNTTLKGVNNESLVVPYSWVFTTKDKQCELDSVGLLPNQALLRSIGTKQSWNAFAIGTNHQCSGGTNYINPSVLSWTWANSDDTVASLTPNNARAVSQAKSVGSTVVRVESSGKFAESLLDVFGDTCTTDAQCQNPGAGISCFGSACDPKTKRCLPTITAVTPGAAAVGDFVTLNGCYFGAAPGAVKFTNEKIARFPDPSMCGNTWSDRQIITEVPFLDVPTNNSANDAVTGPITIKTLGGFAATSTSSFVVGTQSVPGICRINPSFGRWGDGVNILGKGFGSSIDNAGGDRVIFAQTIPVDSTKLTWSASTIQTPVPPNSITGPVEVRNNTLPSNPYQFRVLGGGIGSGCGVLKPDPLSVGNQICSPNKTCGIGLWCELAGPNACTCQPAPVVSVLNAAPEGLNQCLNVHTSLMFNQLMDQSTLTKETVQLWQGTPNPGGRPDLIPQSVSAAAACAGKPLVLTGSIMNAGEVDTGQYEARLGLGSVSCSVSTISTKAGVTSGPLTCSITPTSKSSAQLSIQADSKSRITESDETNNQRLGSMVAIESTPSVPGGFQSITIEETSVSLQWNDTAGETGYSMYRAPTPLFDTAKKIGDLPQDSASYTDQGLVCGQKYYYWIESKNSCGSTLSQSSVIVQTPSCTEFQLSANPSSLSISAGGNGSSEITAQSVQAKSTSVTFSVSGCPTGAACAITPVGACAITPTSPCVKTLAVSSQTASAGSYQLAVKATSLTNAIEQQSIGLTIGSPADTTPPVCGVVNYNPPLSNWTKGPVDVSVACSDSGSGCVLPSASLRVVSNGSATIPISDKAGNLTQCPYSVTNIDTTPPAVALPTDAPSGFTMENTNLGGTVTIQSSYPTARWTTSDTGAGVARVELWRADHSSVCNEQNKAGCLWDQARWSDARAANQGGRDDIDPIELVGGNYWYGIHAVDKAGNCVLENNQPCQGGVGDPIHVLMDVRQPDFSLSIPSATSLAVKQGSNASYPVSATSLAGFSSAITFTVSGAGAGVTLSFDQPSCSPTCAVNLKVTASPSAQTGTFPLVITGSAGTLVHSIQIPFVVSITDISAPVVGVQGAPSDWQKNNTSITATCLDSGDGCDPASLLVHLAANNSIACSALPLGDYLPVPQPALDHAWACATALDKAGNRGFSNLVEIKIDKTSPNATSFTGTPGSCGIITWAITGVSDTGGSGLDPNPYSFDNGVTWLPANQNQYVESRSVGGSSTRTARVRDLAGNEWVSSPVVATAVECDVTPPAISFDIQSRPWGIGDVPVTITVTDSSGVATTRHCITSSTFCDPGTTLDQSTFTSGTPIVETRNGSWTICAVAKDVEGNWSTSPTCSLGTYQIDKTAPIIASFAAEGRGVLDNRATSTDGTIDIAWSVSDSGGSGLKQVEVWRALNTSQCNSTLKTGCNWGTAPVATSVDAIGSWSDTQTNGTYWYGIHAVDNVGPNPNCISGDTSNATTKGHCGGVTSDSEDSNRARRDPVAVDVAIPVPSFTISLSPTNVTVAQGIDAQYSVSVTPVNNFTADVTSWSLKTGTCPGNTSNCSLSFTSCPFSTYRNALSCGTLTIKTGSITPNIYSGIAVEGTGGGITKESNTVTLAMSDPWWNLAWANRRKLTIQNAGVTTDQLNVPVLVVLKQGQRIDYPAMQTGGVDLRFVDRDGTTQLPYEIETWNPAGDSYVWVKIPELNKAPGVDYIWMYYGNKTTASQTPAPASTLVWDSTYKTVWHMAGSGTTILDSTGNGNSRTLPSTWGWEQNGRISNGLTFSARAPGQGSNVSTGMQDGGSLTIEMWYKGNVEAPNSAGFDAFVLTSQRWDGWTIGSVSDGGLTPRYIDWTAYNAESVGVERRMNDTDFGDGVHDYFVATESWGPVGNDNVSVSVYKNGIAAGSFSSTKDPSPGTIRLGTDGDEPQSGASVDEFRISTIVRTPAWISIQNASMNDTLLAYGNEERQIAYGKSSAPFIATLASQFQFQIPNIAKSIATFMRGMFGSSAKAAPGSGTLEPTSLQFVNVAQGVLGCTHSGGCTVVNMLPQHTLQPNAPYSFYVAGGVKSKYGTVLASDLILLDQFSTGGDICLLTSVEIEPPSVMMTQKSDAPTVRAIAKSGSSNIVGIPGVYSWSYAWSGNNAQSFTVTPASPASTATLRPMKNGRGTLTATATIVDDKANVHPNGLSVSDSAPVDVFLCDNPWVYDKADQHVVMKYCRDGDPLLPEFSNPPSENKNLTTPPGGDPIRFDSLFLRGGGSPDAIGFRIYSNDDHLNVQTWYNKNITTKGSPSSMKVDGFDALRDGRTVYISAINTQGVGAGQKTYTNIYVLSYNEGADALTKLIFDEIVESIQFMTNVPNETTKEQFKRDAMRLTGVGTLISGISNAATRCPTIAAGTFLQNRSTSAWPSWNQQLGSLLGLALPLDPLNTFEACPAGYEQATCWNTSTRDFQCPAGSHVIQYIRSSDQCQVGANFEQKGVQWEGSLPFTVGPSDECMSTVFSFGL